jgi:integrase/recombinase XerD
MLIASGLGITENPFDTDKVPSPAKDSGRKRPTEMIDFAKVLEVINQPDCQSEKGRRDRAMLATLFGSGLRRSEVVAIRLGDVRRTSKGTMYLYLRSTKAKKDAEQVVPEWAASAIEAVLKDRAQHGALTGDYLFISYTGQAGKTAVERPLSDSGLYKLFKSYCLLAGVIGHVSPHSARATAITKLLDDGVSHREVQEFSRHSSVSMVEAYDKRRFDVERNPGKKLTFDKK